MATTTIIKALSDGAGKAVIGIPTMATDQAFNLPAQAGTICVAPTALTSTYVPYTDANGNIANSSTFFFTVATGYLGINGLTLAAVAAPSSVGSLWYDSTQLCVSEFSHGGVKLYSESCMFTSTGARSAINSGANTATCFGAILNTKTTPAGFWIAGRAMSGKLFGVMTSAGGAATIAILLKLGATTIATFTTGVIPALASVGVEIEWFLNCQSVAAPNSAIYGWIKLTVPGAATAATAGFTFISVNTTTTNITTANTQVIDVVWTWGGTISTSAVTFYGADSNVRA